jgi:hypothetical protein
MISFRDLFARVSSYFRKRELDRELDAELGWQSKLTSNEACPPRRLAGSR